MVFDEELVLTTRWLSLKLFAAKAKFGLQVWNFFFSPHLFPADVRGQVRQPVLGGRHTAGVSRGLPAVIRQEFGELGDVTADAGTMGGQFKQGGRQRPLCRDGNDGGPAGEPCIRRSCTKPRRGLSSACLGEGPGDLQAWI